MSSPFDTERPLLLSPGLAATIGLEEACVFATLSEVADLRPIESNNFWQFNQDDAIKRLPFFSALDIERISKSLAAKGLIQIASAPFHEGGQLWFCFHQAEQARPGAGIPIVSAPAVSRPAAPQAASFGASNLPTQNSGATLIGPNWQPDNDTLARLSQLNVDEQFARQQIPEFVTYWRESGESHRSWGAKFHQQVIRKWRERETFTHSRDQMRPIDFEWRPSPEAMEMMIKHAAITPQFVEDAIPEFILYWNEKGTSANTWNTKFIQHVRRQWARFQSSVMHDSSPQIIAENWQPGPDVYDILRLANIDTEFAQQQIPEFVLYWKETKQANSSWNTKFLQHVKYHWAQRHQLANKFANKQPISGQNPQTRSTRERSLAEDLTDTSW